jgi:hypothetical protein
MCVIDDSSCIAFDACTRTRTHEDDQAYDQDTDAMTREDETPVQLMRNIYKRAQRDPTVLDVSVELPTEIFKNLRQSVEIVRVLTRLTESEGGRETQKAVSTRDPAWLTRGACMRFGLGLRVSVDLWSLHAPRNNAEASST